MRHDQAPARPDKLAVVNDRSPVGLPGIGGVALRISALPNQYQASACLGSSRTTLCSSSATPSHWLSAIRNMARLNAADAESGFSSRARSKCSAAPCGSPRSFNMAPRFAWALGRLSSSAKAKRYCFSAASRSPMARQALPSRYRASVAAGSCSSAACSNCLAFGNWPACKAARAASRRSAPAGASAGGAPFSPARITGPGGETSPAALAALPYWIRDSRKRISIRSRDAHPRPTSSTEPSAFT